MTPIEGRLKLLLISDFNITTLAQFLNRDMGQTACVTAPFGQVVGPLLNDMDMGCDFGVVWTTPEKMIPAYGRALNFETYKEEEVLSEVRQFTEYIKTAAGKFRAIFLVCWTLPSYQRGRGMLDRSSSGLRTLLAKMNLTLTEELQSTAGVYILDGQKWVELAGRDAYSPKLWYLTKTPFHPDVFKEAARDIEAAICGIRGGAKKLIVLDLDNTLWGGTVGDLGWQNVRLGGHDYIGEAFVDFQKMLKALSRRGILLSIVSKNEEAIALEALSNHVEMILRPSDFVGWKINWGDKATNIAQLAAELNLGLQSIVFIDDNPVERARVREALTEVYVPEWPSDVTLFPSYLLQMSCFDSPYTTIEDGLRTEFYAAERQREQLKKVISSHDEWLCSLNTEVLVEPVSETNRVRVVQLLNKTNQMNLRSRRMTEKELLDWLAQGPRKLWAFRVKDRLGDSGLTGVLALEIDGATAAISDFVLSCRMMGRNIERVMAAVAAGYCRALNVRLLLAQYVPSAKNTPCLEFWKSSGFELSEGDTTFNWSLNQAYPYPKGIKVTLPANDFAENALVPTARGTDTEEHNQVLSCEPL